MKWRGMQGWRPGRAGEWFGRTVRVTEHKPESAAGQEACTEPVRPFWGLQGPETAWLQSNKSSRLQTREKTKWNQVRAAVEPPWVPGVWEVEERTIHPLSLLYSVSKSWDDFPASFTKCTNFKTEFFFFFFRFRRKCRYQAVNNTCRK